MYSKLVTILILLFAIGCGSGNSNKYKVGDKIVFRGLEYGMVKSPITNRVWLDRNLGASRVCKHYDDIACFGDYYQWGRGSDGHEDSLSSTNSSQLNIDKINSNQFIIGNFDWASNDSDGSKRASLWSKSDGTSICPNGFRVPTIDELKNEISGFENGDDAYKSFLKLPLSGFRQYSDGTLYFAGQIGYLWSVTPDSENESANYIYFENQVESKLLYRANGYPVRCIQSE